MWKRTRDGSKEVYQPPAPLFGGIYGPPLIFSADIGPRSLTGACIVFASLSCDALVVFVLDLDVGAILNTFWFQIDCCFPFSKEFEVPCCHEIVVFPVAAADERPRYVLALPGR